jgi:hypothetical protein
LEERFNRPPTIRIPAGARLQLLLLNDLVFPAPPVLSRRMESEGRGGGPRGRAATGGRPYTSHAPTGTGGASPLLSPSVLHPSGWHSVAPGVNPGETVGRAATGGRPYTSHAPAGTGGAPPPVPLRSSPFRVAFGSPGCEPGGSGGEGGHGGPPLHKPRAYRNWRGKPPPVPLRSSPFRVAFGSPGCEPGETVTDRTPIVPNVRKTQ